MDIIIYIFIKIAILELKVELLKRNIKFIIPSIKDYTRFIIIIIKLYITVIYPVFFIRNSAKSVIIIRNIISYVISFAYYISRIIPGFIYIANGVYYYI